MCCTCKMKAQIGQPRAEQAPYQSPLWAESHEIQKLLCTSLQRNWRKWETKGWELQRRNKTQRESEEREANVERRDYVRVEITDQEGSWNIWNCNDCEGIVFRSRQVELWTLEALRQSCVSVFIISTIISKKHNLKKFVAKGSGIKTTKAEDVVCIVCNGIFINDI